MRHSSGDECNGFYFLEMNIETWFSFALTTGSRWRVKQLTYSITKYPSGLKSVDVDRELGKAFQVWADVTELTFVHLRTGKVHIEIRYSVATRFLSAKTIFTWVF